MLENKALTDIDIMGEFGLIDHLASHFKYTQPSTLKGIGDDAAVIDRGDGKVTLVSTDLLLEGVHFDIRYVPMKHLGYKAVTVNLSDIYAMNGTPTQITVSIGVSSRFSLEAIEELYTGIQLACEAYGVDLVGGDTSTSQQGLVISITAVGVGDKDKIVYRSGAKEHDLICVSGDLGSAYIGLQFLEREKRIFLENPGVQPDLAGKDYVLERQLKPEARKDIIEWLAKEEIIPTSMIDISDGLSSELIHIATQSKVGVTVYEDKFPIDPVTYNNAFEIGLEPTLCALNGGEDYELLFTVSQKYFEKIKSNTAISIIGHCTATNEGLYMQSKSDQRHVLVAQGWKHLG